MSDVTKIKLIFILSLRYLLIGRPLPPAFSAVIPAPAQVQHNGNSVLCTHQIDTIL